MTCNCGLDSIPGHDDCWGCSGRWREFVEYHHSEEHKNTYKLESIMFFIRKGGGSDWSYLYFKDDKPLYGSYVLIAP